MRKIFRDKSNRSYWDDRWEKAGVDQDKFTNENIYPIKYSNLVIKEKNTKILEAGCGAGRVYFHYKNKGYPIHGIENSDIAVNNILSKDPKADVVLGSITQLPYESNSFDVVLAFGLYHNIESESELQQSLLETARVLRPGGKLVASVRCDNLENNLIERIVRSRKVPDAMIHFHRWHFNEHDVQQLLSNSGLHIDKIFYSRNVSFLFKFDLFRSPLMKGNKFRESDARSSGFQLNWMGRLCDYTLHKLFPRSFSNLMIVLASKN
jgi:SAM-dependent methyltransferase